MRHDPRQPITSAILKSMTEAEVIQYWRERQRANRADGKPFYETLIVPETGAVAATID